MSALSRSNADHDLGALQARALRRRQHTRSTAFALSTKTTLVAAIHQLRARPGVLPARFALHLLVAVLVPLAAITSQSSLMSPAQIALPSDPPLGDSADFIAPVAPLSLDTPDTGETPAPDSAFAAIDALPVPALTPNLLALRPIAATVVAETANVRGGPGTNYDKIGTVPAGTALQVLARYQDWYQARAADGRIVWITAELLDLDATAAEFLPEAANIPAAPPPRVGLVAEDGLNLRDGPSKTYIGVTKLNAGTQLDLIARYQDWFQAAAPDGQIGWVLGQYLRIGPGVIERVETMTSVPDPNPALVGATRERGVNLRGGPGTAYAKLGVLGAGVQLELLARYEDWFNVRTPRGTTGWISNELVDVRAFVTRRVPLTRDIPALPRLQPAARPQAVTQSVTLPAPAAAAGSVTEFALQFVGARYVWGGAGSSGFDCSGFTMYVYKQFGLNLPHSSAGQYSTAYGTMISNPADLRLGDIVFFVNTYKRGISHVGIYIGNGNVVQAMSPKLGVGVANVNDRYWSAHYYGAIRPTQ